MTTPSTAKPTSRWRRRTLLLCGLLALIALHTVWLPWVARGLIVDTPAEPADYVLLLGGDRAIDVAAEEFRSQPSLKVLILEGAPSRLERLGIEPRDHERTRAELNERGIPDGAVSLVEGNAKNEWQATRQLAGWMQRNPTGKLLVLCDRFRSRIHCHIAGQVLAPEQRSRLVIRALPDRRYDATNWWRSRQGLSQFADASLSLAYVVLVGEDRFVPSDDWEHEAYIRQVCRQAGRLATAP